MCPRLRCHPVFDSRGFHQMTPVEDKIRKLLELASHPNTPVDEARTAAHQAAKLMREHKVEVGGAPAPIFGPPIFDASPAMAIGTLIHTMIEVMLRSQSPPPAPPAPPFDPMAHPEFWERWDRQQRAKKKRRRSKQSRKNNPNRERKRKRT